MGKMLLANLGLLFIAVSFVFADEDEGQKCYWTDDCDRSCREDEYVAAESTFMMCSEGEPCHTTGHHRTNKFCCSIPKSPPSKWLPMMGHGPVCNVPGGIPCANLRGQQGFAECHWTEDCGRPCKVGEYAGAESGRLTNGKICPENEGVHRYCCKGPKIIWTTSD